MIFELLIWVRPEHDNMSFIALYISAKFHLQMTELRTGHNHQRTFMKNFLISLRCDHDLCVTDLGSCFIDSYGPDIRCLHMNRYVTIYRILHHDAWILPVSLLSSAATSQSSSKKSTILIIDVYQDFE